MSAYSDAVLADNPLGYWRLDETPACGNFADGGEFADSSGNGHPAFHYGEGGNCLATDVPEILCAGQGGDCIGGGAVHAVARVTRTTGLEPNGAVSCEMWMLGANIGLPDSGGGEVMLWYGGGAYGFKAGAALARDVVFFLKLGGVTHTISAGAGTLAADNLVHLVGTYDGSRMRLVVNTVEADDVAQSGSLTYDSTTGLGILNQYQPGVVLGYANTPTDEVAIYDYALSDFQIQTHYALGTCGEVPVLETCQLIETDGALLVDTTYQDVIVTLMDPAPAVGHVYHLKNIGPNTATLDPGTLFIDDLPSFDLLPYQSLAIITTGSAWYIVAAGSE